MTDKLISDLTGIAAGLGDNDQIEAQRSGQTASESAKMSDLKTYIQSWLTKAMVGLGNVANSLQLVAANNLSDLTDAAAARNNLGTLPPMDPDFNDSSMYLTTPTATTTQSGALTAQRLYMLPIWVPRTRTYSTYAIAVSALVAGTSSIRVGLYNANSSLQPTTKIDEGATTIDTSSGTATTGVKTVAFTANQSLKPGLYFLAVLSDTAPSVYRIVNNSSCVLGIRFNSGITAASFAKYRDGVTYGTLPSDESGQAYSSQASAGASMPCVGIR